MWVGDVEDGEDGAGVRGLVIKGLTGLRSGYLLSLVMTPLPPQNCEKTWKKGGVSDANTGQTYSEFRRYFENLFVTISVHAKSLHRCGKPGLAAKCGVPDSATSEPAAQSRAAPDARVTMPLMSIPAARIMAARSAII